MASLKEKFMTKIGPMRERVQKLNKEHGSLMVDDVNIGQIIGGMRDIRSMWWVISDLDPQEGIRFRGLTIPDLQAKLPKAPGRDRAHAGRHLLLPADGRAADLRGLRRHHRGMADAGASCRPT